MTDRQGYALEFAMKTDAGKVRSHNEDAVFADAELGLAILADGMGGCNAGEVASEMAVSVLSAEVVRRFSVRNGAAGSRASILEHVEASSLAHRGLQDAVAAANAAIFKAAAQAQYAGMGTTLVAALFHDHLVTVAHIGDSRLYRLRDGALLALTRDHSLLQEQIDRGMISVEEARYARHKNLVTRALGVDTHVEPEIHAYPVQVGDVYLLCSDGLNDMLGDDEIRDILVSLSANLDLAATQLIQLANDHGGRDNVSAILVRVLPSLRSPGGWRARAGAWLNGERETKGRQGDG